MTCKGIGLTTDEILRPDVNFRARKWWWQFWACDHCWHLDRCDHQERDRPVGTCWHRRCCHCNRVEVSFLMLEGHGKYAPKDNGEDISMVWSPWRWRRYSYAPWP